jgi:hypothetical protein
MVGRPAAAAGGGGGGGLILGDRQAQGGCWDKGVHIARHFRVPAGRDSIILIYPCTVPSLGNRLFIRK